MQCTTNPRVTEILDFPLGLIGRFRASYSADVLWHAPRRGVTWKGHDQVVTGLLREAAAMRDPRYTRLRRSDGGSQVFDEFVVRFTYEGTGIENVDMPRGAMIELERLRILTLDGDQVQEETAVETWTILSGPAVGHAGR